MIFDIELLRQRVLGYIAKSIGTAKGDIVVFSSSATPIRVEVGTNDQVLTADSGETAGVKWADAGGSLSEWTAITDFNDDPTSTSTITTTSDLTATIKVGMPIKFTLGGTASNPGTYYAICTAITSNLLTIAGAPLETDDGDLTALYYGLAGNVKIETIAIPGYFADAANTTLLATDLLMSYKWLYKKSYLVKISHIAKTDDSGANQPRVNAYVNSAAISTENTNAGRAVAETWTDTVVDINASNYDINPGEALEISADANGSNDDAQNLTVMLTFVLE